MSRVYKNKQKSKSVDTTWREPSDSTTTVTPSSSQDGEGGRSPPRRTRSPPRRTQSGNLRGSSRFSTKSSDERKPWLGAPAASDDGRGTLQRTSSGRLDVLYAPSLSPTPTRKKLTLPSSPGAEGDDDGDNNNSNNHDFLMDGTIKDAGGLQAAQSFDDLWDESARMTEDPTVITTAVTPDPPTPVPPPPAAAEVNTRTAAGKEMDTGRFTKNSNNANKKGSRAPPNTPTDGWDPTTTTTDPQSTSPLQRKEHPIRHPRKTTGSAEKGRRPSPIRTTDESETNTSTTITTDTMTNTRKQDTDDAAAAAAAATKKDEKPKPVYKDKDEAISSLEKQLDRVTFLQKRQFDQLSSLKKMLLASRAKEKEHAKVGDEWKQTAEIQQAQISALQEQLQTLQTTAGVAATAASSSLAVPPIASHVADQELQEKDAKIAQLEQQLEDTTKEKEATADQLGNSLAVAESKLRKKADQYENLHEEMEEMRERLTTANQSIEQLEEERNFSRAKMAELNDMMSSKGGLTDAETERLERAAEISSLSAKLSAIDGKVQDRDNKIFKLEEEINGVNELVKQLSDAFVGGDKELMTHQDLLLESAVSPSQTSSLLLMTMMNMLDSLKAKLSLLQKERDDMNAKASDRGIQLAESHIRVDKLRTELRRMRVDRERARTRATQPLNPNDPRRKGPPPPAGARPYHASHTGGPPQTGQPQGNRWAADNTKGRRNSATGANPNLQGSSERSKVSVSTAPPGSVAAPQKPSRFMSFIKGNLTQEVGKSPKNGEKGDSQPPPMIVTT